MQRLAAVESLVAAVEVSAEGNVSRSSQLLPARELTDLLPQKSKIINLVNELHSKLRQVEDSSFEESASSPAVAVKHSNFTKKLKKISSKKKDVIGEPDKNYYDVFPALSRSAKKANLPNLTTAIVTPSSHVDATLSSKPSSVKLSKSQLCWSALMSSVKKEDDSSVKLVESKVGESLMATKQRSNRRKVKRNGKLLNTKIDVQYNNSNAKTYDVHHNATFLPKASKNNTKKQPKNCLGESKQKKCTIKCSESGQD